MEGGNFEEEEWQGVILLSWRGIWNLGKWEEEEAVMRVHRIGQTKQVMIKRFIVKGSVEERMEAVQARKQRMISGALTDQEVRTARIEELKMLFA